MVSVIHRKAPYDLRLLPHEVFMVNEPGINLRMALTVSCMREQQFLWVLIVLLATPVLPRRGSSGGGSQTRGQGAARGSDSKVAINHKDIKVAEFVHNQIREGTIREVAINPKEASIKEVSVVVQELVPASRSSAFKTALIGGALGAVGDRPFAGLVAFEAGKAIIQSATRPFNHDGHDYYWDNHYQPKSNEILCSMPLSQLQQVTPATTTTTIAPATAGETVATTAPQADQVLNNLQFADGTRPKQITWACRKGAEVCCGTDCCPAPNMSPNGASEGGGIARNMAGFAIG
ncbi:hypothetical protein KIN20_003821, partial [Parelaphostrongylus tenuis]